MQTYSHIVTPCVGVWIEIHDSLPSAKQHNVTPCVGVWIEIISIEMCSSGGKMSLPAWECGLKLEMVFMTTQPKGHSLRGSVD